MSNIKLSDEEFIKIWLETDGGAEFSKITGLDLRSAMRRRVNLQKKHNITLPSNNRRAKYTVHIPENKIRVQVDMDDGVFVVFSDAHYWPGLVSTAHKALVKLLPEIKPQLLIANGDILDGASISRHARIGYEQRPNVKQELEAVQTSLHELEIACKGNNTKFIRTIGNHCVRFESRIANDLPQYEGVPGMTLDDHLPMWRSCWSIMINEGSVHPVMIKHRWHNGIHATLNNTMKGGVSIFTGHLHALGITRFSDFRGPRYGVDTGTLAEPWGPQFNYMEDNSRNWRSGFAVGTIKDGILMPPELCEVISEDSAWWRGNVIKVV